MAKLTKKQVAKVERSKAALERGIKFIMSDRIVITSATWVAENVKEHANYTNGMDRREKEYRYVDGTRTQKQKQVLTPMNKQAGSELCQLHDALRFMNDILEENRNV